MAVVQIENLLKTFGSGANRQPILNNLSLTASAGESLAIIGKSGSGKSTLLNIIGGLENFDTGSATVFGKQLEKASNAEKDRLRLQSIGIIFQFFHLLPTLSLWENAMLPAQASGLHNAQSAQRLRQLFETLGLGKSDWKKFPHEVSGGMLGRTGVARALLKEPKLILADEPTGNLDSVSANQVLELLLHEVQARGITLLLVTHDHEAAQRCQKSLSLVDGSFQA